MVLCIRSPFNCKNWRFGLSSDNVLISLMIKQEELLSRLYDAFRSNLPATGKLWDQMTAEEKSHAAIIRCLGKKVAEGKLKLNTRKINANQLLKMIECLENTVLKVEKKGIKQQKAFEFAIEYENSMLENSCFEVFEGDSFEVKHDFELLREHTKQHRNRLDRAFKAFTS